MAELKDNPFVEEIDLSKSDGDLIRAYRAVGRTVDDLAYTDDFDRLYELYTQGGNAADKHQVFKRLLILRKSGLLPRLFRQTEEPAA